VKATRVLSLLLGACTISGFAAASPSLQSLHTKVFSFGYDAYGEDGLGTVNDNYYIATPIIATNFADKEISQMSAGKDFQSLLVADDGTVLSFGTNANGLTGLGIAGGNTPIATPINTSKLFGKKITRVAAGAFDSLLLSSDGTVF
jgi:alpha-tubulin suppressor-like RCC1 family protein